MDDTNLWCECVGERTLLCQCIGLRRNLTSVKCGRMAWLCAETCIGLIVTIRENTQLTTDLSELLKFFGKNY